MTKQYTVGKKIAVIADDLTGANDTGVQFAKQGLKTIVLMGMGHSLSSLEEDVVVVDTQSRALSPDEAYKQVSKVAMLFNNKGQFQIIYKKIDSTLRGNIGKEIDAIMDACKQELAIVAPAFPKNGRITVGGYHFLQGSPLEATEIARDPKCPIHESHLPTLLSEQTKRKVGNIGIKSIMAGPDGILEEIKKIYADDRRIIVCDVWLEEHFKMIILAAARFEKRVLWVGSAGLAEYLPSVMGLNPVPVDKDPVVILAGSVSNITRGQISKLKQRPEITYLEIDPCALLQQEAAAGEIKRCFDAAIDAIKADKDVVIVSGYNDEIVAKTKDKGTSLRLSSQQTAEAIAAALGELCRQIALNIKLSGLILTGGDTAVSCCSLLSANGITVVQEVAPGIPIGRLKGGPCDGLRVVTKAGAFGAEDALCNAVDCLKQSAERGKK
jgi:uncharacterized protein YgbK (DUF1537 family)